MEVQCLIFFPLPYILDGKRFDGLRVKWPDRCKVCKTASCESAASDLSICSYGYNYLKLDKRLIAAGFIVKEFTGNSPARVKLMKKEKDAISILEVENIKAIVKNINNQDAIEISKEKEKILTEYKTKGLYKREILELLKPELDKAFSSLHDYRHFVAQVSQNINVILETRYQGPTLIDEKLRQASHAEKAIYWLVKLMEQNFNATLLIKNPERISDASKNTTFSLHGLLLKHIRIYQMTFDEANIEVIVRGRSDGKIHGNSEIIAVILHTFIDNAYKYSPQKRTQERPKVIIEFHEDDHTIDLSVTSFGPRIADNEREKIFQPFERGKAAEKMREEGTGFGLYASRLIARSLGTDIRVEQDKQAAKFGHLTTFSITFQREA